MRIRVKGRGIRGRAPSIILALTIAGVLGALGYTIANPPVGKFTEFYISGLSGKATDYPEELMVGKEGKVIVGIINREQEVTTYRIEVVINGVRNSEIEPVTLEHNGKWEEIVSFTPDRIGDNQRVEFLLYRQGQNEVYQRLYFWVDVSEI